MRLRFLFVDVPVVCWLWDELYIWRLTAPEALRLVEGLLIQKSFILIFYYMDYEKSAGMVA